MYICFLLWPGVFLDLDGSRRDERIELIKILAAVVLFPKFSFRGDNR